MAIKVPVTTPPPPPPPPRPPPPPPPPPTTKNDVVEILEVAVKNPGAVNTCTILVPENNPEVVVEYVPPVPVVKAITEVRR